MVLFGVHVGIELGVESSEWFVVSVIGLGVELGGFAVSVIGLGVESGGLL